MDVILINIYNALQKDRRKLLIQSLIFIFFLIGVNIFAWFTYVLRAETSIDAMLLLGMLNLMLMEFLLVKKYKYK